MVQFETLLRKFNQQGEKTGWTYFEVPAELATQLKPDQRKSFRVKGKLDNHTFSGVALVPMGGGNFIFAVNATMRKAIKKGQGAMVSVQMEMDPEIPQVSPLLLACLDDEPRAKAYFDAMPLSHQLYYTRWIDSAKTEGTRTKRIAMAVNAMAQQKDFGQMLRDAKKDRALLR